MKGHKDFPKGWKPHPGIDVLVVRPSLIEGYSGIAAVGASPEEFKGQRHIWISSKAKSPSEVLGHEIGHVVSGHLEDPEVSNLNTYISQELEAWDWLVRKKGGPKRIKTRFLENIVNNALGCFGTTVEEVLRFIKMKLLDLGYPDSLIDKWIEMRLDRSECIL